MPLAKPYRRIWRPKVGISVGAQWDLQYMHDSRWAPDLRGHIAAFHLIQKQLIELFEYVEPSDDNRGTYSHQIYQLFLRACTEVETNSKAILAANGYAVNDRTNIVEFRRLEKACKLSHYVVSVPVWRGTLGRRQPFQYQYQRHGAWDAPRKLLVDRRNFAQYPERDCPLGGGQWG